MLAITRIHAGIHTYTQTLQEEVNEELANYLHAEQYQQYCTVHYQFTSRKLMQGAS